MKEVKTKALTWKTILKKSGLEACRNPNKRMNHYDNHSSVIIEIGFKEAYLLYLFMIENYREYGCMSYDRRTENAFTRLYKILDEYENT